MLLVGGAGFGAAATCLPATLPVVTALDGLGGPLDDAAGQADKTAATAAGKATSAARA